MTEEMIYNALDGIAILAVAIMLYLTEPKKMETPQTETEQRIHAMLDDAVASGYDITKWPVDDIVADLLAYAELTDDETEEEIKPHVITWKQKRAN